MKNTIKISIMSGLVTAGVLLCGVHIANAQTNIDTGYTITIPSEVGIDKDSGKGSFSVSGKIDAQTELDVTTTSQNDYKLKCGSQFIDYTLDKESFHINNVQSADSKSFNESFTATVSNANTNFSGSYKDNLVFDITGSKISSTYEIAYDLQGGSVDSKINNPNNYKIIDDGDYFIGLKSNSNRIVSASNGGKKIRDTLEITAKDSPSNEAIFTFERYKDTPYYYIFNKGSGKAINISGDGDYCKENNSPLELWYQYDVATKEDAQDFLWFLEEDDNNCIKIVNKSTNKVWSLKDNDDSIGTILYQRNDAEENGQKFVLKEISISSGYPSRIIGPDFDTEVFINYRTPIKVGYKFKGWKIGDKVYQPGSKVIYTPGNAKGVTAIAQWEKQYTLTFDANGGIVSETSRAITEGSQVGNLPTPTKEGYEFYGWYTHPQSGLYYVFNGGNRITEDTTVVAYWGTNRDNLATENKNALSDGTYKIFQIQDDLSSYCFSPRFDNDDSNNPVLLKKDNSSEYALWEIEHDEVGYVLFKNKKTGMYLDLNSAYAQSGQEIQLYKSNGTYAQKWIVIKYGDGYKIVSACNPSFVIDLSGADLKDDGNGHLNSWIDNGTLAQRWNFKRVQTPGTQINIENNTYAILKNIEGDKYLVLGKPYGLSTTFQSSSRVDGLNQNTYEGCEIDKEMENNYYGALSQTMKSAIQLIDIKQSSYSNLTLDSKQEQGPNGQIYNILQRHVFIPSVEELANSIGLEKSKNIYAFMNDHSIWLRDSFSQDGTLGLHLMLGDPYIMPSEVYMDSGVIAPAFVIDLSKVDYTVTGTVNYK